MTNEASSVQAEIAAYLKTLAPHIRERLAAQLLERALAELEQQGQDSRRYRWLRERLWLQDGVLCSGLKLTETPFNGEWDRCLDVEIDKRMAKT